MWTSVSIFWFNISEVNEGLKRRRLEAAGQENRSPKPSSSRRIAELETKPDTPVVPSVRTRVQQLTQRRDGKPNNNLEADANTNFPRFILKSRRHIRNSSV